MGKKVGAALAFSAAVMLAPHAHAMSELEELMGEPVEALSDNELSDLRGGFVTVRGVKFDIGIEVTEAVNGQVLRHSTAVLSNLRNRMPNLPGNVAFRRPDDNVEPEIRTQTTEVVTNDVVNTASATPPALEATTGAGTGLEQTAALTDTDMSFETGLGTESTTAPGASETIGSAAQNALAGTGSLFDVQTQVIDINNADVEINQVINLTIANYSVMDAMAARARVESKIANVVNSQVLFSLGQQF